MLLNMLHVAGQNWGQVDNFRFNCCFICVDAANPVLDRYVEQRVDCMIDAGLLDEVYDIYNANADYTRGLRQAIGVREFEDFLSVYHSVDRDNKTSGPTNATLNSRNKDDKTLKDCMRAILKSSADDQLKVLLEEAIDRVKLNTRRLVRCQVSIYNLISISAFLTDFFPIQIYFTIGSYIYIFFEMDHILFDIGHVCENIATLPLCFWFFQESTKETY